MVSRGWPAITVHTPPNPPLKKYLMGLTLSDMIIVQLEVCQQKYWRNSSKNQWASQGSKYTGNWPLTYQDHKFHWSVVTFFTVFYVT